MSTPETEILIPDDEAPAVDVDLSEKPAPAAAATPAVAVPDKKPAILEPEAGLEKLKRQLDEEKRLRAEADQRARTAEADKARAQTENQDSRLHLVTTAIANVTQAMELGESQYAEALAATDYAKAAKIQREMATNAARLQELERGKTQIEQRAKQPAPAERTADPVEALASRLAPRAASWLRSHPECATGKMNQKMLGAHHDALSEELTEGSQEYFDYIETRLGYQQPTADPDPAPDTRTPARRAAPAAAPVSRSGNGAGERPGVIRLTPQQVEAAALSGMTNEEYARQVVALRKEGKLS